MFHLVGIGDCDPMVLVFKLVPVQLTGEGCDMCVGCVVPRHKLVCLDGDLLLGYDYVPLLYLLDHCLDCLVIVPNVVFLHIFNVLRVDARDNGFGRHRIHQLLEGVLLPI